MTFSEVQKKIKIATDSVLPTFKGKIEAGGNINYRKRIDKSILLFNQNMLNYKTKFGVSCSFMVSNDYFRYHKNKIFAMDIYAERYIALPIDFTLDNSKWAAIKTEADLEHWVKFLNETLPKNITEAEKCTLLEKQEEIINKSLLSVLHNKESLDTQETINGMIYAKLANKPYFEEIHSEAKSLMIELKFGDLNIGWLNDAYNYLKDKSQEDLFNI
jgi:hypothetical protein